MRVWCQRVNGRGLHWQVGGRLLAGGGAGRCDAIRAGGILSGAPGRVPTGGQAHISGLNAARDGRARRGSGFRVGDARVRGWSHCRVCSGVAGCGDGVAVLNMSRRDCVSEAATRSLSLEQRRAGLGTTAPTGRKA